MRRSLSLILGMRDNHSYPQARYFIPRLFSLPLLCDLSIAAVSFSFNGKVGLNSIYIGGWIETKNPSKTPQIHPSQSGILLHGRANLSCSPRTQVFPTWWEPCLSIHGDGWLFITPYQLAMVGRVRVERTFSVFQTGAPTLYATAPYKNHSRRNLGVTI